MIEKPGLDVPMWDYPEVSGATGTRRMDSAHRDAPSMSPMFGMRGRSASMRLSLRIFSSSRPCGQTALAHCAWSSRREGCLFLYNNSPFPSLIDKRGNFFPLIYKGDSRGLLNEFQKFSFIQYLHPQFLCLLGFTSRFTADHHIARFFGDR